VSKLVTTTANSGLMTDNQHSKIYGSSPAGPTENQALTLKSVGAFLFYQRLPDFVSEFFRNNFTAEREGFEPNSPICSISIIYENSFR
jgi:hypothetical protein